MSKRFFLSASFICFFLYTTGYPSDRLHILEKGETLYSLSRKYAVPLTVLLERNRISSAEKITAGQKIYIPETYIVQKGDTLYGIARKHGVSVEALKEANGFSGSAVLTVGKVLILPDADARPYGNAPLQSSAAIKSPDAVQFAWEDPREYTQKSINKNILWPVAASRIAYLSGKLYGVAIDSMSGESVKAIASGRVTYRGPHRGYGQVVFIESKSKHVYVYGGLSHIMPQAGDRISVGQTLGTLAADSFTGIPRLYFMVYKNNKPIDPATAPRGQ